MVNEGNGVFRVFGILGGNGQVALYVVECFIPTCKVVVFTGRIGRSRRIFTDVYGFGLKNRAVMVHKLYGEFFMFGVGCVYSQIALNVVECLIPTCESMIFTVRICGSGSRFAVKNGEGVDFAAVVVNESNGPHFHVLCSNGQGRVNLGEVYVPTHKHVPVMIGQVRSGGSRAGRHFFDFYGCSVKINEHNFIRRSFRGGVFLNGTVLTGCQCADQSQEHQKDNNQLQSLFHAKPPNKI